MHRRHVNGREPPGRRHSRRRRRRERHGPVGWGLRRAGSFLLAALVLAALAAGLAQQRLRQGPISLGPQAAALVASRIEAGAEGVDVEIGDLQFALGDPGRASGLRLINVTLRGADGAPIASAPELVVDFRLADALQGRLEPTAVELRGAALTLSLEPDGRIALDPSAPAPGTAVLEAPPDPGAGGGPGLAGFLGLLDQAARGEGPLQRFASLSARDASVTLHDARTGRAWRLQDAELVVALEAEREIGRLSGRLIEGGPLEPEAVDDPVRRTLQGATLDAGPRAYPEAGDLDPGAEAEPAPDPYVTLTGERARAGGEISARLAVLDLPVSELALAPALGELAGVESRASGMAELTVDATGAVQSLSGRLSLGPGAVAAEGLEAPFDRIDAAQVEASWSRDGGAIELSRLAVSGPAGAVELSGLATPWGRSAAGWGPAGWSVDLSVDRLLASQAAGFVAPTLFRDGRLQAEAMPAERRLELTALDLPADLEEAGPLSLHAEGVAALEEAGPRLALRFGSQGFGAEALKRVWPVFAAPGAREWVEANVAAARITGMSGAFWMAPGETPEVTMEFGFADLSGSILEGMPELTGAEGTGHVTLSRFEMAFDAAQTTPPGGEPISLAGSRFVIPDLIEDPQPAAPVIRGEGRLADLLTLIDQPPLQLTRKLDVDLGGIEGRAAVEAQLSFRLLKDLDVEDVAVEASARISGLDMTAPGDGPRIRSDDLLLEATPEEFRLSGPASIAGRPAQVSWTERFDASLPEAQRRQVSATVTLTPADIAQFGLSPALEMPQGRIAAAIDLVGDIGEGFSVSADLGPAALRIAEIGWEKAAGEPGRLRVSGRLGDDGAVTLDAFEATAAGLSAKGKARLGAGSSLRRVTLERLALDGVLDAAIDVRAADDGALEVTARGRTLDIAALTARRDRMAEAQGASAADEAEGGDPLAGMPDLRGELAFDVATLVEGVALHDATGEIRRRRGVTAVRVSGAVNGGGEARLRYREGRQGGISIALRSDDAGRLLDDLSISDGVQGGALRVRGRLPPGQPVLEGVAELTNLRVAGRKALEGVVTIARRDGIIERRTEGEYEGGYHFDRVEAPFRLNGGIVTVTDALATGPLLALKVNGDYDLNSERLDLQGVLTPAYAVNGILNNIPVLGELFGGEGEGLFAMNFTVAGAADDPQVNADPLSILTPGILRRLLQPSRPDPDAEDPYPDLFETDK
ncbi:AsmA-like C-terminal domain-containing protein [Albimonas pacifica]|uniref:AsmA-like C-terminal region n=1 Tax=Albimonas pacifica TaxID=1114924 RepID=A0A1I3D774_9RHOB|nr:AsmA-like C-terminal domain-containing protein [Albimonas pacifica]SFH82361.1 AsmA-like C-terminal region [Albimonas pacifica]